MDIRPNQLHRVGIESSDDDDLFEVGLEQTESSNLNQSNDQFEDEDLWLTPNPNNSG